MGSTAWHYPNGWPSILTRRWLQDSGDLLLTLMATRFLS